MLERDGELATVADALDDAMAGQGRLLVVEGLAGIGKTTLLRAAAAEARARRMVVLHASGAATEHDHPFGVVRRLLHGPFSSGSAFLSRAAELARPVFEPRRGDGGPGEDLGALLHGLHWLVADLAEDRSVLLSVDDAHWADERSLRFLLYFARRLEDLPVVLLVATRPREPGSELALLASWAGSAIRLGLRPLTEPGAAALLTEAFGSEPEPAFAHACWRASGGNPFLLRELARDLVAHGVAPVAAEVAAVSRVRPAGVSHALLVRVASLPEAAADLARALAVLECGTAPQLAALAGVDGDRGDESIDALVDAGLVEAGEVLRFSHPIVREAVYGQLRPRDRARRHRAAARVLAEHGGSDEEIAAHLLAGDAGSDPGDTAVLERAAAMALRRGDPATAVACLRPVTRRLGARSGWEALLRLGSAELAAGRPDAAVDDLSRALAAAPGPSEEASVARALAAAQLAAGRPADAVSTLEEVIERLDAAERELVLRLEGDLAGILLLWRGPHALQRLDRFADLRGATPGERVVLAGLTARRVATSPRIEGMADMIHRALAGGLLLRDQGSPEGTLFVVTVAPLAVMERHAELARIVDDAIDHARARGSLPGVVVLSTVRAAAYMFTGDVRRGEATAAHALDVAREIGSPPLLRLPITPLLLALVERGALAEAAAMLRDHGLDGDLRTGLMPEIGLLCARAALRLARHEAAAALEDALGAAERSRRIGVVYRTPPNNWRPLAVRAHLELGDEAAARAVAREDLRLARESGRPRSIGIALHHAGLAEGRLDLLEEAVATLERSPAALELGRALADLGAALRRRSRPEEARRSLRRACELAEACGAAALEARAAADLAATGARRRRRHSGLDDLTPSELRIAELAAGGLTNKQIAQALFVTRKTVETHLGSVFRKLGVAARTELPAALATRPPGR